MWPFRKRAEQQESILLGDAVILLGMGNQSTIDWAVRVQCQQNGNRQSLGRILVRGSYLTEAQLTVVIAFQEAYNAADAAGRASPASLMMAVLAEHAGDWKAEAKAFTARVRDQLLEAVPEGGPGGE